MLSTLRDGHRSAHMVIAAEQITSRVDWGARLAQVQPMLDSLAVGEMHRGTAVGDRGRGAAICRLHL